MEQPIKEAENQYKFKFLKPEDIKLGMRVKSSQLSEIFDTYIILTDVKFVKNKMGIGALEGIVSYISDKPSMITQEKSVLIYHDSYEKEENCEYE